MVKAWWTYQIWNSILKSVAVHKMSQEIAAKINDGAMMIGVFSVFDLFRVEVNTTGPYSLKTTTVFDFKV